MGVGGQRHAPADLLPRMTRYPLYRSTGGPQAWPGRVRKMLPPSGFDPQIVQSVAINYTDWAIPAHQCNQYFSIKQPKVITIVDLILPFQNVET